MPEQPHEPADRLVDAVIAILLQDGFEGVSVRKVATRAGVSIGAVQHHFPTKDAMLNAAMDRASTEFEQRLAEVLPSQPSAQDALRAVTVQLLGHGAAGRVASVIWLQRVARAAVDEPVRQRHARQWQQVEDLFVELLSAVRPGQPATVARDQAALLLSVVDGLAISHLVEPRRMPAARAVRLVRELLDTLVTKPR